MPHSACGLFADFKWPTCAAKVSQFLSNEMTKVTGLFAWLFARNSAYHLTM